MNNTLCLKIEDWHYNMSVRMVKKQRGKFSSLLYICFARLCVVMAQQC